jgi:hypothetical protein
MAEDEGSTGRDKVPDTAADETTHVAAIEPEAAIEPKAATERDTVAVLVFHGMGQQVRFETLNLVADSVLRAENNYRAGQPAPRDPQVEPAVNLVRLPPLEEPLPRVEITVTAPGNVERDVHLYEVYWSPLTEGKVRDRDVVSFMFSAGWNGLRRSLKPFERLMFGDVEKFPLIERTLPGVVLGTATFVVLLLVFLLLTVMPVWAGSPVWSGLSMWLGLPAWLGLSVWLVVSVVALTVVGSRVLPSTEGNRLGTLAQFVGAFAVFLALIVIQALVAAVAAARVVLGATPAGGGWPNDALLGDLTVDLLLIMSLGLVAGMTIWGTARTRQRAKKQNFWAPWRLNRWVRYGSWFVVYVGLAGTVVAALGMLLHIAVNQSGSTSMWWEQYGVSFQWLSELNAQWAPAAANSDVASSGTPGTAANSDVAKSLLALEFSVVWGFAYYLSDRARWYFRQYLGDVAAYVSSHTVNQFWDLRHSIQECAAGVGTAVYSARGEDGEHLYKSVTIVGHSLGSIVAYDTLNELLRQDALAAAADRIGVADRTELLLTFGSPLDKTAYVFGTRQPTRQSTQHLLEELVQPLISDYGNRPRHWLNIWSRNDWISGPLDFYDKREGRDSNPKAVKNCEDKEASTPLRAHNEYWGNLRFVNRLYEAVSGRSSE